MAKNPSPEEIQELRDALYPACYQAVKVVEALIQRDINALTEAVLELFLIADREGLLDG